MTIPTHMLTEDSSSNPDSDEKLNSGVGEINTAVSVPISSVTPSDDRKTPFLQMGQQVVAKLLARLGLFGANVSASQQASVAATVAAQITQANEDNTPRPTM